MKELPLKTVARTPKELAKAAMKQQALAELKAAGFATEASVEVTYMGIRHTVNAPITCNVENGQIMFHFGAVGKNRLNFEPTITDAEGKRKQVRLTMGLGGNLMTGQSIDNVTEIREKYGLKTEVIEEDLDAGETTE